MAGEKLKEVVAMYRKIFQGKAVDLGETASPVRGGIAKDYQDFSVQEEMSHMLFMCDEIVKFVDAGRIEKAMRWYGFLQGVFWVNNDFTIEELGKHSMPGPEVSGGAISVRTCHCSHPFNQHAGSPAIGKCLEEGCCCLLSIEQLLAGEGQ